MNAGPADKRGIKNPHFSQQQRALWHDLSMKAAEREPVEHLPPSTREQDDISSSDDTMISGRKYRLRPTPEQAALMAEIFGSCRAMHNAAVQQRNDAYEITGKSVSYQEQTRDLKELRDCLETAPWLKRVPSQVLQQALRDVDASYQRFFGGAGYPNFQKRGRNDSFRQPQSVKVRRLNKKWAEVHLANLGWVRFRMHRPLEGVIKSATVKLKAGQYYLSFQVEMPETSGVDNGGEAVGADLGVAHTVATSDGQFLDMPPHRPGEDERLRKLQKKLARQAKGSKRREKTKMAIAKIHARQARRRHDFAHKTSHALATGHRIVGAEDMRTKSMVRSARWTVEEPGKNVAQKRGLNKAIHEQCWGLILSLLDYKCDWYGSLLVKVPAAYSSQECSQCGHVHKGNRRTQSLFKCLKCGYTANADTNAANVIKGRALKLEAEQREVKRLQRIERKEARERAEAGRARALEARWAKRRLEKALLVEESLDEKDKGTCITAGGHPGAARGGYDVCGLRNENQAAGMSPAANLRTASP